MSKRSMRPTAKFQCLGCRKMKDEKSRARGKKICKSCHGHIKTEGIKVYGKFAYVPCPTSGCEILRRVSLIYRLSGKFDPSSTCPQCAAARQSQARKESMAALVRPTTTGSVIRMNGCELRRVPKGRCNLPDPEPCCAHYLECLEAVSERNWPGWVAVKAREATTQEA